MRAVLKADGTVVAENDFYPFGKRTPAGSPYLDFGARMYSPDCTRWLSVDPMAEKYYGIGTHVYCAGDPVNSVDPNGLDRWILSQEGYIMDSIFDDNYDIVQIIRADGTSSELCFGSGALVQAIDDFLVIFSLSEYTLGMQLMLFLSQQSNVEYGIVNFINSTGTYNEQSIIKTDGKRDSVNLFTQVKSLSENDSIITSLVHSHPNGTIPSGFNPGFSGRNSDRVSVGEYNKLLNSSPLHFVYSTPDNVFYRYDNTFNGIFELYSWEGSNFHSIGKKQIKP